MSEPYREGTSAACPACAHPLREFGKRMVCDDCDGMLLSYDDFAASLRELDGSTSILTATASQPDAAKCPRCGGALVSCDLTFGKIKLPGRYLACEHHGVWVASEAMVGAFAVVGQRARRSSASAGPIGDGVFTASGLGDGGHGMGVAVRSVGNAFANRPQFVSLGSVMPRTRTAFVSAFDGQRMACPACAKPLVFEADRWACRSCTGSFVEDAALVAMVQDITQAFWEMPAPGGGIGKRACPACTQAMAVEQFHSVEIDRCKGHGVWFDAAELETALVESTEKQSGTGSWLKRLFGRAKQE